MIVPSSETVDEITHRSLSPAQLIEDDVYRGLPADRFALGGGVELERFGKWQAGDISLPPTTHHRISIHVQENGSKASSQWSLEGQKFSVVLEPALVVGVPAGLTIGATWDATAQGTLNFMFTQEALVGLLEELEMPSMGLEVLSGAQGLDPALLTWAQSLLRELNDPRLGDVLMRDALKQQMLVHVLRHYTNRSDGGTADRVGQRDRLVPAGISAVLEYMHAHLEEPIGLDALSAVAKVSRFHFSRLFKQTVGRTPGQELTRLRVERAKQLIRRDGRWKSLATIASECGFADQSHLGRHFRRLVGITPGAFRRSG